MEPAGVDPAGFEGLAALLALPALATTAPLWHAATVEAQGERPELAALLREAFIREASDNLPAPLQAQHRAILIALLALARDCAEAFQLTNPRVRLAWLQVADRRATAHLALVLEDWPVGEVLEPAVLPPRHAQGGAAGAAAQPQAPPAFAPGRAHVEFRQLGIDCLCASAASAEAYYRLLLHAENRRLLGGIGTETEQLVSEKAQWAVRWAATRNQPRAPPPPPRPSPTPTPLPPPPTARATAEGVAGAPARSQRPGLCRAQRRGGAGAAPG